jgi:hypothetical protein
MAVSKLCVGGAAATVVGLLLLVDMLTSWHPRLILGGLFRWGASPGCKAEWRAPKRWNRGREQWKWGVVHEHVLIVFRHGVAFERGTQMHLNILTLTLAPPSMPSPPSFSCITHPCRMHPPPSPAGASTHLAYALPLSASALGSFCDVWAGEVPVARYSVILTANSFVVKAVDGSGTPRRPSDLLLARVLSLTVRYACYLEWDAEAQVLICPSLGDLSPGRYRVVVVRLRSLAPNTTAPQCSWPLVPSTLAHFIFDQRFPLFENFLTCFEYPNKLEAAFSYTKFKSSSSAEEVKEGGSTDKSSVGRCTAQQAGGSLIGRWMYVDGTCVAPVCQGVLDRSIYFSVATLKANMRFVFAPFLCYYYMFSAEEARTCMGKTPLYLLGDSRFRHVREHIEAWTGVRLPLMQVHMPSEFEDGSPNPLSMPMHRLGLATLFPADGRLTLDARNLFDHVLNGSTVLLHSSIHDLTNFDQNMPAAQLRGFYNPTACLGCNGTIAACGCSKRWNAPHSFMKYIYILRDWLMAAQQERAALGALPARLFWVSMGTRQVAPGEVHGPRFEWRRADLFHSLETLAADILAVAGVQHIDLEPLQRSAPQNWWADEVHLLEPSSSPIQHMAVQVFLNRVCV